MATPNETRPAGGLPGTGSLRVASAKGDPLLDIRDLSTDRPLVPPPPDREIQTCEPVESFIPAGCVGEQERADMEDMTGRGARPGAPKAAV